MRLKLLTKGAERDNRKGRPTVQFHGLRTGPCPPTDRENLRDGGSEAGETLLEEGVEGRGGRDTAMTDANSSS